MSDLLDRVRALVTEAKEHADASRPVLDKFRARRENLRKIPAGEHLTLSHESALSVGPYSSTTNNSVKTKHFVFQLGDFMYSNGTNLYYQNVNGVSTNLTSF